MNNEIKFDPMTGQPINNTVEPIQPEDIAKQEVDAMMQRISNILVLCVNGEDPDTCAPEASNCSGSCATCGGCH